MSARIQCILGAVLVVIGAILFYVGFYWMDFYVATNTLRSTGISKVTSLSKNEQCNGLAGSEVCVPLPDNVLGCRVESYESIVTVYQNLALGTTLSAIVGLIASIVGIVIPSKMTMGVTSWSTSMSDMGAVVYLIIFYYMWNSCYEGGYCGKAAPLTQLADTSCGIGKACYTIIFGILLIIVGGPLAWKGQSTLVKEAKGDDRDEALTMPDDAAADDDE